MLLISATGELMICSSFILFIAIFIRRVLKSDLAFYLSLAMSVSIVFYLVVNNNIKLLSLQKLLL